MKANCCSYLRLALLLVAAAVGCNEHTALPTAPLNPPGQQTPLPPSSTEVWITGSVYDASHNCLNGAEVSVDRPSAHSVTDCAQRYAPRGSYVIKGMQEGAVVSLRATLAGYRTNELQTTLHGDLEGWAEVNFVLEKE